MIKYQLQNLYTSNFNYAGNLLDLITKFWSLLKYYTRPSINCVMVKINEQDRILVASAFTLYHLLERDSSFELDFLGYDQNSFFRNKILK